MKYVTIDGNEAASYIAHKTNEVIAIYPISPSSPMGENADAWSAQGVENIWGVVPRVQEMQSEGGAAGSVHGALQTGSMTTTFTASQGLLLMIPNMFKISGELTSTVFHIAARTVATHSLSIFCDHSDVMAARSTGWSMLFSNSVQEVMDFALISQAATLEARVPFLHIFDGFRVSHEVKKIVQISDDQIHQMINEDLVREHRMRGLSPDRPVIRGTSQNPDAFFQSREAITPYYTAVPSIVQNTMDKFAEITGRQYHLFEYLGAEDAENVIIMMGSGSEAVEETVDHLAKLGEKIGLIKVRLFRPFDTRNFTQAIPSTVKKIAVMDRTKEPGSIGEPLYQDVITAISEAMADGYSQFDRFPRVIGGRYGLSSKEFTPAMIKGIFDELIKPHPKNHFTVGIQDDVSFTSLKYDENFITETDDTFRAMFWGLGSDGTVGANKNSIKIIGETTDYHAQGYFVYDSKKAGAKTVSHLRFGDDPIHSSYLIQKAKFIAVHQFDFVEQYDVLAKAEKGATFLLNSPFDGDEVWAHLPRKIQATILEKQLNFYVIDAAEIAKDTGMGSRINTIMQTCFFAISGILPKDLAIEKIKEAIRNTYGKRGEKIVQMNYAAVDASLSHLYKVIIPDEVTSEIQTGLVISDSAPDFVKHVTAELIADRGDQLPVSAFPVDGTYPVATAMWEKRNLALQVPVWEDDICIQCGKCVMVCPHATIRSKLYDADLFENAPSTFKAMDGKWRGLKEKKYTIQVATEDCTGCELCVEACPAFDKKDQDRRALNMAPQRPLRETERENWDFFVDLPETPLSEPSMKFTNPKNIQLLQPLFEFSGACEGCGETPYLSLLTRLYGDRTIIANATGCSSIYGGNLPTTPWTTNKDGRGPAWINSLFEDNAELGLGMRLSINRQVSYVHRLLSEFKDLLGSELVEALISCDQTDDAEIVEQRKRIEIVRSKLAEIDDVRARDLISLADVLVDRSVWIVGGDGWAYDIGFGGLDHVLASGENINVLVLDTEVYSNTGGQASKATPLGAVARFAASGKRLNKKDLGMIAIGYGNIYVAQIAMGASDLQTIKAFVEAASYDGPSLIIAYSQCIEWGIDMTKGMHHQKLAVDSGMWPMYRFDPRLPEEKGKPSMQLDYKGPKIPLRDYIMQENRFRRLLKADPEHADGVIATAEEEIQKRWETHKRLAQKN